MRKFLVIALSIMMLFAFTACEENKGADVARTSVDSVNMELKTFMDDFFAVSEKYTLIDIDDEDVLGKMKEAGSSITDMYVDLGSFGDVTSFQLSGISYDSDDPTMKVSVGMGAFYEGANVYKVTSEGKLLVNKVSLLFSVLAGEPLIVNGVSYDDYSVGTIGDIDIIPSSIKLDGEAVEAAEGTDGYYNITITEKNKKLTYKYTDSADDDRVYVITRDTATEDVTQNSIIEINAADEAYAYLSAWDADITESKNQTIRKDGIVIGADGAVKGMYELKLNVTFTPSSAN